MQTNIHPSLSDRGDIKRAEEIIKSCVHCGFCTAHCPTYQMLGDERDGPRGRIYLIKQMIEENNASEKTSTHLDRCLTCRACETACPAGVKYSELLHTGRKLNEEISGRSLSQKILKNLLSAILPYSGRVSALFGLARLAKPFLPKTLSAKIPDKQGRLPWPAPRHERQMMVLAGCVQSSERPNTNQSMATILDRVGISVRVMPQAGCCGAVDYHMGFDKAGLDAMRNNIDAWWPAVEEGIEAILMSASACALQIKEYGELLKEDTQYAEKAKTISALAKNIGEVLVAEDLTALKITSQSHIAIHCPCTLQHGQDGTGQVEEIFSKIGLSQAKTRNGHLCCGSAGTYSLQQPALSKQLLNNKIDDLTFDKPDQIVTSNIGCQLHLASQARQPVKHWVELLAECMESSD